MQPQPAGSRTQRVTFVDSHTAGEPTRVITSGFPQLRGTSLAQQRESFTRDFDHWRSALVNEPRGNDVLVGALLVPPVEPNCAAGVIFFNNVGPLGMCGHGTIGLIATLAFLGRIGPGRHRIDTPVGVVEAELHEDGHVSLANIPAYRHLQGVEVDVPGHGTVSGDVAWGGNWFFISERHGQHLEFSRVAELADFTLRVKRALQQAGITGANGAEIDHVELTAPLPSTRGSRNFVMCPGGAYDRSPCGTGTSAKLACLAADGKLNPHEPWVQESIIGSRFTGTYETIDGQVIPTIHGEAFVTAQGELLLDERDPFLWGIRDEAWAAR